MNPSTYHNQSSFCECVFEKMLVIVMLPSIMRKNSRCVIFLIMPLFNFFGA